MGAKKGAQVVDQHLLLLTAAGGRFCRRQPVTTADAAGMSVRVTQNQKMERHRRGIGRVQGGHETLQGLSDTVKLTIILQHQCERGGVHGLVQQPAPTPLVAEGAAHRRRSVQGSSVARRTGVPPSFFCVCVFFCTTTTPRTRPGDGRAATRCEGCSAAGGLPWTCADRPPPECERGGRPFRIHRPRRGPFVRGGGVEPEWIEGKGGKGRRGRWGGGGGVCGWPGAPPLAIDPRRCQG